MTTNNKPTQLFKRDSITHLNGNGAGHAEEEANSVATEAQAAQVDQYLNISLSPLSTRTGVWIDCGLPSYPELRILYRVNNQTSVRKQRPTFAEPHELRAQRRELAKVNEQLAAGWTEELESQQEALLVSITEATNDCLDAYHKEQSRWLANFVISFDNWPFEDVVEPDPDVPDSYAVLPEQLEDLYLYLLNTGYQKALIKALGNS